MRKIYSISTLFCIALFISIVSYFFFLKNNKYFFYPSVSKNHTKTLDSIFVTQVPSSQENDTFSIDKEAKNTISGIIKKGQHSIAIIQPYLTPTAFYKLLRVVEPIYSLKKLHVGQPYTLIISPLNNTLERFEYEINSDKKLIVEQEGESFKAYTEPIVYINKIHCITSVVQSSLFEAIVTSGEAPSLALRLVEILNFEIDFTKDLRFGDSFSVVFEKQFKDKVFKKYGRILGVSFNNNGIIYEGYRFHCDEGYEQYYNADGKNLKKVFLKTPLAVTRISSGYSLYRTHPIYCDIRPHLGVDYAAPIGTPVKTVADGVIVKVGWGQGFGKMIIVRHINGIESMYSHLSGFRSDIKIGRNVKQGETIGYVGTTGTVTGPHLDFRIRQKGHYINPTQLINPRMKPVSPNNIDQYKQVVSNIKRYMKQKQYTSNQ